MQKPIVIQLQEMASDSGNNLPDLLRKALVISTKLGLTDFRKWVWSELNGYESASDIPDYRVIFSQLKAVNPFHGLVPFIVEDSELAEILSRVTIFESIESLQHLVGSSSKSGYLTFPFSSEQKAALMNMQSGYAQLEPTRTIGKNQVAAILQKVRTQLLDWSLNLEAEGILGDGLSFSEEEREIAHKKSHSISIENFQGVLGDVSGGSVSQSNTMNISAGNFDSLARHLKQQGVTQEDINDLESAVKADESCSNTGKFGAQVSHWIGKMTAKAADGSWNVGISAAGGLLASALSKFYGL